MRTVSGDRIVEIASEAQMTARLRPYSDHDRFLLHEIPGYPDHDRPSTVHRFGTRIESNVAQYMISKAPRNRDDARDSGKIRRVFAVSALERRRGRARKRGEETMIRE